METTLPCKWRYKRVISSVFLVAIYALIFTSVLFSNILPEIPDERHGLDLDEAYFNLHQIATQPHPVNSHANDLARKYILDYLRNTTSQFEHVEVVDDLTSNITWVANSGHGVSFEGSNVLVKIAGTDSKFLDKSGVLFSAHFDSVPTGPGVTDDGMGVVTLMELIRYLAAHRTKRTAIFNINNGEEDGLKGAFAFLHHPWSKITDTFVNLEGAAAGGRPILFRSTSMAPVLSFKDKGVLHPHGNVLSADAFSRRVIKSRTDYTVYEYGLGDGSGMEGIDFAFYQGRSSYHTKYDSIPGAKGGRKALWAMMDSTRAAGLELLNRDDVSDGKSPVDAPVYFDLFGQFFFVFTQRCLFNFNAALLITGPVILLVLNRAPDCMFKSIPAMLKTEVDSSNLSTCIKRYLKFWVALLFAAVAQALLAYGSLALNPFIIHSSPFVVLASHLSLAYLSFFAVLRPTAESSQRALQRLVILVQTYIFSWILLLAGNVALDKLQIGGVYFLTGWNASVLLACVLVFVERIMTRKALSYEKVAIDESADVVQDSISSLGETTDDHLADTVTEKTPLMTSLNEKVQTAPKDTAAGWWMSQALFAITVPVILLSHVLLLLVQSLSQTLSDGSPPLIVHGATALFSMFIIIPIMPFSGKIHQWITFFVALSFVISTTYSWTAFPFSQNAPLKIFFQQKIVVDLSLPNEILESVTTLTGATRYLEKDVVAELPSSWKSNVTCTPSSPTISLCQWVSPLIPSPTSAPTHDSPQWISANITRTSTNSARIHLKGTNTRSCRLYFDNRRIKAYNVHNNLLDGLTQPSPPEVMHKGYPIPTEGLSVVQLWSRTWDRKFTVDVTWQSEDEDDAGLSGRVACEWAEFESGTIGLGLPRKITGTIPAYEEVLTFLPLWAAASKVSDGLVEVYGYFSV